MFRKVPICLSNVKKIDLWRLSSKYKLHFKCENVLKFFNANSSYTRLLYSQTVTQSAMASEWTAPEEADF